MNRPSPKWHFKPLDPAHITRESPVAAFFTEDKVSKPGVALVREGIQNALDAKSDKEIGPVLVRISLSEQEKSVPASKANFLCEGGLWEHLSVAKKSFPEGPPSKKEPWSYFAFEDFGTTGLEGDETTNSGNRENRFRHFFRAEGQSDKESGRGSWGIGKQVFWASSRIKTAFGFTVRENDKRSMLMGTTLLTEHTVKGKSYQEGYYGLSSKDGMIIPTEEKSFLLKFSEMFGLSRKPENPGLSLIVPYPQKEIDRDALVKAVLEDYFYPILSKQLDVFIETRGIETCLDQQTYEKELDKIIPKMESVDDDFANSMRDKAELARYSLDSDSDEKVTLCAPPANKGWTWSKDLIPQNKLAEVKEKFNNGDKISFEVPVTVRANKSVPEDSSFDIFIMRSKEEKRARPTFVREGIVIPEVDTSTVRGVTALVVVNRGPLANFLRDAEGPAHINWRHGNPNFKGKYRSGKQDLLFVKQSVKKIVGYLMQDDAEVNRTLLKDFFPRPSAGTGEQDSGTLKPDLPSPTPQEYGIQKTSGGFSITGNTIGILNIQAGYDIVRGSPLRKYRRSDFNFSAEEKGSDCIQIQVKGAEILHREDNCIRIKVGGKFSLRAIGFDQNRDIYVQATREGYHDSAAH